MVRDMRYHIIARYGGGRSCALFCGHGDDPTGLELALPGLDRCERGDPSEDITERTTEKRNNLVG
jgi:hypothetical protein